MIFAWVLDRIFLGDVFILKGLLGDVVFSFYVLGDVDLRGFFALGFAWGGFAWGCDLGGVCVTGPLHVTVGCSTLYQTPGKTHKFTTKQFVNNHNNLNKIYIL